MRRIFRNPFDLEGVKLDLRPVSFINFLFMLTTSLGVNSFNPIIRNASKPFVIRASEYPSQKILSPFKLALTKTSETQPCTLFSGTKILLFGTFNFLLVKYISRENVASDFIYYFLTVVFSYSIFELIRKLAKFYFKKEALGQGDSKLVAMTSLWLGPIGSLLSVGFS